MVPRSKRPLVYLPATLLALTVAGPFGRVDAQATDPEETGILFAPEEENGTKPAAPLPSPATPPPAATAKPTTAQPPSPPQQPAAASQLAPPSQQPVGKQPPPTPPSGSQKAAAGSSGLSGSKAPNTSEPSKIAATSQNSPNFGQYRVRLGVAKPRFSNELKYYESFYGTPSVYPTISADWYAFDWYATFGISLRGGFYTDEGKAGKIVLNGQALPRDQLDDTTLQPDVTAPTTLTLIPMQSCLMMQFTPFDKKWIVLDGWIGLERLYFQEVRAGSSTSSAMIQSTGAGSTDTTLTNNGFKNSMLYGFGANIRIDTIDQSTTRTLQTMGLSSVYFTPYVEFVQQTDQGANFSRMVQGFAFVFESVL